jgi:hypothetical protein
MTRPSAREVAQARQTLRQDRKAKAQDKRSTFSARPFPKREKAAHGRERDAGYLTWLHEGLPCIACNVLGTLRLVVGGKISPNPIEAAHQKLNVASRGVQKRLGVRPSDLWCVPLCRGHHREGPVCCDAAQTKFWALIGLTPEDVADFCLALYRAYGQEADGSVVVREFASIAAGQRSSASPIPRDPSRSKKGNTYG